MHLSEDYGMKFFAGFSALVAASVVLSAAQAATVTGKAKFKGTAPKPAKIKMNTDPQCMKGDVFDESVVANADGTLKNVFVYVKSGLEGKSFPTPSAPAQIDQVDCHYVPHVMGVMVNQPFEVRNSDATLHNIHAMPEKSAQFNLGMPMKGMKMTRKFDKPEVMVTVKCDVHPWMHAFVGVMEHPFYAVSDGKGAYALMNLPAGKYVIAAWHEKFGTKEQTVTVEEGKAATADFTFEAGAAK
jgi:hypothetical protein